jgi:L,D-peptidoglycan transpeptidase YkuD (ErfK/YbiS/YcfS/YnhG family)
MRSGARRHHFCVGSVAAVLVAFVPPSSISAKAAEVSRPANERFSVPASSRQLIVVSSSSYDPPNYLARIQTFERTRAAGRWRRVFPAWQAEVGSGELRDVRLEGDHATPTGVYAIGRLMYGNRPNPGGLHEGYHRLVCGDWWDEDPYSSQYNEFVHVACGSTPPFAGWSEALWTETTAYPYFAVIEYNEDPKISGADAPGSGIFLHAWVDGPTEGCVALRIPDLLQVLRWLQPGSHPVIEIGTDAEVGHVPPPPD